MKSKVLRMYHAHFLLSYSGKYLSTGVRKHILISDLQQYFLLNTPYLKGSGNDVVSLRFVDTSRFILCVNNKKSHLNL